MLNNKALDYLHSKYDRQFSILSSSWVPDINQHQFLAQSEENLRVSFSVSYNQREDFFADTYMESYLNAKAQEFVLGELNKLQIDEPYSCGVSFSYSGDRFGSQNFPNDFSEVLKEPRHCTLILRFTFLSNSSDKVLEEILPVDHWLRSQGFFKTGILVGVFDSSLLQGKYIEDHNFTYMAGNKGFEYQNKNKLIFRFQYYIDSQKPPVNLSDLKEILSPDYFSIQWNYI